MTCAYDEEYLLLAQRMLGDMYDYAVNTLGIRLAIFQQMFLVSQISIQISKGNPMYIAGMNGCEVAKKVIEECRGDYPDEEDLMYIDKSREYWAGWALAYYQWESGLDFKVIEKICPVDEIICMYVTFHEADISLFVETMNEKLKEYNKESKLKRMRKYASLTQRELAEKSGVPLRQVQLFEQGYRDIKKCQAAEVVKLAKILGCQSDDLL